MEDSELRSFLRVCLKVLACLCYCYFIASNLPKGKFRLFSLLPVFYIFSILPLSLSSTILPTLVGFIITWLANFKLLLFSFDLGPLSQIRSLLTFILIAAFPIRIKQDKPPKAVPKKGSIGILMRSFWCRIMFLYMSVSVCVKYKGPVPSWMILALYFCAIFFSMDLSLVLINKLVQPAFDVELEPPSDDPYLATSLQNFWGRRWNLVAQDSLCQTVYKPLRWVFADRSWAPVVAFMAVFLVSGLLHELIFFYTTRVTPSGEVASFFVLNGFCVILELIIKKALGARWSLPRIIATPLTVGFVMVTGFWLFFPPLLRNNAHYKSAEECKSFFWFILRSFGI